MWHRCREAAAPGRRTHACPRRWAAPTGWQRPRAYVYPCTLRDPLPDFPLPLQRGEAEPLVPLNATLHGLYARARYDLELDYALAPKPPLRAEDAEWARQLVRLAQQSEGVSG